MDKETTEIAKLTARISKDPKSKLFVPLAEEYKKAGDIEMAIYVLLEGLKSNPEYVTGRFSLGKLLLAKGDLSGAQKEFEEVLKTNPDNLMAQKKLGDLFILQDRPHDALPHYKSALSSSPGDAELASLILDLEAGRDVRSGLQAVKAKTTDEQVVKQEPPASVTVPEPWPVPVPPQPLDVELKTALEAPLESRAASAASLTGMAQAPSSSMIGTEEPEEVLVVEPLEPETSELESPMAGIDSSSSLGLQEGSSSVSEERFDFDLSADDKLSDEPVISQDIRSETDSIAVEDGGAIPTVISQQTAADEIIETGFGGEVFEKVPESSFQDDSGKSDDFTTDTLAELYISQGFYEKAIEIYERMLADRPNSRGLQDKLAWVRAAFARTAAPAPDQKEEVNIFYSQEAREYVPVAEAGQAAGEQLEEPGPLQKDDTTDFKPEADAEAGEFVPSIELEETSIEAEVVETPGEFGRDQETSEEKSNEESREQPGSEQKEQRIAAGDAEFDIFSGSPALTQDSPEPTRTDFEPREYVPPAMEQEPPEPGSQHEGKTPVPRAGRKETIARLETWLTAIKKER
jgi:tetratricopeptide (TPR) repeat protein